jgi:sugar transferase (PEP-CTERM/EpsH1 system associated)
VAAVQALCASLLCVPFDATRQTLRSLLRPRLNQPFSLEYSRHDRMRRWVERTLARGTISDVFAVSAGMADYVIAPTRARRVLDLADIESEKFRDYAAHAGWPRRLAWAREARTLLALERRAARAFDRTLFVSAADSARFLAMAPESSGRVGVVENGVDLDYFSPSRGFASPFPANSVQIVFTGAMDDPGNIDAMTWFARDIMPPLLARAPAAHLTIVGAKPAREVLALVGPRVTVTGRVDDVRPYIAHAAVVVAPSRFGRGIQNKVLEAMAMARPVVASPQAYEGIRAAPGRDLLVADGGREMAQAVVDVLDARHVGLAEAARRAMERNHSWQSSLAKLDELLDQDFSATPAFAPEIPR